MLPRRAPACAALPPWLLWPAANGRVPPAALSDADPPGSGLDRLLSEMACDTGEGSRSPAAVPCVLLGGRRWKAPSAGTRQLDRRRHLCMTPLTIKKGDCYERMTMQAVCCQMAWDKRDWQRYRIPADTSQLHIGMGRSPLSGIRQQPSHAHGWPNHTQAWLQ